MHLKIDYTKIWSRVFLIFTTIFLSFFISVNSFAFTPCSETRGLVSFDIPQIQPVTKEGETYKLPYQITNKSDHFLSVSVEASAIDAFYLIDPSTSKSLLPKEVLKQEVHIGPQGQLEGEFSFFVKDAYVDAHYPLHVQFRYFFDNHEEVVKFTPVITTQISQRDSHDRVPLNILDFGEKSFIRLNGNPDLTYFPYVKQNNKGNDPLPPNWIGNHTETGASFHPSRRTRGEITRNVWETHPAYKGGAGDIGIRFAVHLPQLPDLQLRFYSAMRDVTPPEPPTDGVDFRVYVSKLEKESSDLKLEDVLNTLPEQSDLKYSHQYDGTDWLENVVDLSEFSGQTVVITLEANPGKKNDTTCDTSYWGDVTLLVKHDNVPLSDEVTYSKLKEDNRKTFINFVDSLPSNIPSSGVELSGNSRGFDLGNGQYAVVSLGFYGIFDGCITIGNQDNSVQIDGIKICYQGTIIGRELPLEPCSVVTEFKEAANLEISARQFAHLHGAEIIGDVPVDSPIDPEALANCVSIDANNVLGCFISRTKGGLAFRIVASHNEEISPIQFGSFNDKARRIYFGHGYCIENPTKPFQRDGDGFACSTSHIGIDFSNGTSLLQATTRPVDKFIVDPNEKIYTLSTTTDTRLTICSGSEGAMSCAIQYAPAFDKAPAPLVGKKAGRFVFDYWGGQYATVLERLKLYVKYGLKDSMLIQHVWQHYGYDVRLPDIWPPRIEQGSLEDLKATQAFCDQHDIPFGLHDNYIDFYPDADGFTYDDVMFNSEGQPQKAWYNPGPDAQSYRFNPTKILPYVNRNLQLISEAFVPTAYFTDVFSSIHIMDYYDREGVFHTRTETLDCWNKYFDLVRKTFNDNAITVSESGNDALIGHLDGADAILRRITPVQENYTDVIDCEDYEYVPWFDAVNHNRFILHGVGYSDRYQGGLSRELRGIESDDYICSEVLTGHPAMVDLSTSDRNTIRKYWLLHDLAKKLALDVITDFEFINDNIHRQKITWKSGVVIYVNRDKEDWNLETKYPNLDSCITIPRFGFWITSNDGSYGGVVRINDQVVEYWQEKDQSIFVNGRRQPSLPVVSIKPSFEDVEVVDNKLEASFVWEAFSPTDKPYVPFLHLERPKTWWGDKPNLHVLPLPNPETPTSQWNGRVTPFEKRFRVILPESLSPGYYDLLCGLYDPKTGHRLSLLGDSTGDRRYRLGRISIANTGEITYHPNLPLYGEDSRLLPNLNETNFGEIQTKGGFKLERKSENTYLLIPLPDEPSFTVKLSSPFFKDGKFSLTLKDVSGTMLSTQVVESQQLGLELQIDSAQAFSYEIVKL